MTTLSDGPSEYIYSLGSETELTAEVGAATEQLARVDTQLRQQGAVLFRVDLVRKLGLGLLRLVVVAATLEKLNDL